MVFTDSSLCLTEIHTWETDPDAPQPLTEKQTRSPRRRPCPVSQLQREASTEARGRKIPPLTAGLNVPTIPRLKVTPHFFTNLNRRCCLWGLTAARYWIIWLGDRRNHLLQKLFCFTEQSVEDFQWNCCPLLFKPPPQEPRKVRPHPELDHRDKENENPSF